MKISGMRALVVEPHDVNELIFASYLSHPFRKFPVKGVRPEGLLMGQVYRRAPEIPIPAFVIRRRAQVPLSYQGEYRFAIR